jgi:hypothetical protein
MNTQGKDLTIKITSGGEVSVAGTVFSSSPSANKGVKTPNVPTYCTYCVPGCIECGY